MTIGILTSGRASGKLARMYEQVRLLRAAGHRVAILPDTKAVAGRTMTWASVDDLTAGHPPLDPTFAEARRAALDDPGSTFARPVFRPRVPMGPRSRG